jgi:hypothetical protein
MSTWIGQSDGTFSKVVGGSLAGWSFIGTGDFNGDGNTDVLMRYTDGTVADWLSNGNGTFTGAVLGHVGSAWTMVSTPDLNSDGKTDIVWRDSTTGQTVSWYLNGNTALTSSQAATLTVTAPSVVANKNGLAPQMTDQGSGHEIFVFQNLNQAGSTIEHFNAHLDSLDIRSILPAGYNGGDPTTNGTVTFVPSGADSTAVMFHSTILVTLDHVLPGSVPHGDIVWH